MAASDPRAHECADSRHPDGRRHAVPPQSPVLVRVDCVAWGYTERVLKPSGELEVVERAAGSVVYRTPRDYHRIDNVFGDCRTLFITWDKSEPGQNWGLLKHRDVATPQGYRDLPDGVYRFSEGFRVRANGFWYALGDDPFHAWLRTGTLSVHQNPEPLSKDPVPINVII